MEKVDEKLIDETYWVNMEDDEGGYYEKGFTCFQLLSKMPMAFGSTDSQEMGITEKLVYDYCAYLSYILHLV